MSASTMCPNCHAYLKLSNEWIGKKIKCSHCKTIFIADLTQKESQNVSPQINTQFSQNTTYRSQTYSSINTDDHEEDEFVLDYLQRLKLINKILSILGCICAIIIPIIAFLMTFKKNEYDGKVDCNPEPLLYVLLIIPIIGNYYWWKCIFSWFRGIYRNSMR